MGDTYDISFYVRGKDLKRASGTPPSTAPTTSPATGSPIAAFVEFTDATGQHRQRVTLPSGLPNDRPLSGTFDWTKFATEIKVPADAKRMRVFLGLLPATGQLLLDDISIKVR